MYHFTLYGWTIEEWCEVLQRLNIEDLSAFDIYQEKQQLRFAGIRCEFLKKGFHLRPNHKQLATDIHQSNVDAGWWTDISTGEPLDRNFGEMLALVHSELTECWEGIASKTRDHHLPAIPNWHVELADACIRVYDMLGGCFKDPLVFVPFAIDLPKGFIDPEDRLIFLHALLSNCLENWRHSQKHSAMMYLYRFLDCCFEWAEEEGFGLMYVLQRKWDYNRSRADHKIENRLKEDGKKI